MGFRGQFARQQSETLDVGFVPKADICGAQKFRLFDHLVGAGEQRR
jgi:hypothetical protein